MEQCWYWDVLYIQTIQSTLNKFIFAKSNFCEDKQDKFQKSACDIRHFVLKNKIKHALFCAFWSKLLFTTVFALGSSYEAMFSISRFYHGKIDYISGKTKLSSFYSTHFPRVYVFPLLPYGNICDSLTTIISKSSHGNLFKLCQMAVFNIFVLWF